MDKLVTAQSRERCLTHWLKYEYQANPHPKRQLDHHVPKKFFDKMVWDWRGQEAKARRARRTIAKLQRRIIYYKKRIVTLEAMTRYDRMLKGTFG